MKQDVRRKRAGPRTALIALVLGALLGALGPPCPAFAQGDPGSASIGFRITPRDQWPAVPVTNLVGTAGGEGQVSLRWSAPLEDLTNPPTGGAVSSYDIRYASMSVLDGPFLGDTTAWFNAATVLVDPGLSPLTPGSDQFVLTSLSPGVTYFFGLRSIDDNANVSDIDDNAAGGAGQAFVGVRGVQGITNLTAVATALPGELELVWTAPNHIGVAPPVLYEVRASTMGQISSDAEFAAAQPLTTFSESTLPIVGPVGAAHSLTLTGLTPSVTFYFAMRVIDSRAPAFAGKWERNVAQNLNPLNWAQASFLRNPPDTITNLSALPGTQKGSIDLTWTAPLNTNGVPISSYVVRANTMSITDVGGSTTTWWNLANSTTLIHYPSQPPGYNEIFSLSGLDFTKIYYFGVISIDQTGEVSEIDDKAAGVSTQANSRPGPIPPVVNLSAVTGTSAGEIELSWTEPDNSGGTPPFFYIVNVSTVGNLNNTADFDAAQPLSAFSPSTPPMPGIGGADVSFVLTGLQPFVTYYFGIRQADAGLPPTKSVWFRDVLLNVNQNNFARPKFPPFPPNPITDLTALAGTLEGDVDLVWTAPLNQDFAPIASYEVRYTTYPAALLGDATAWFNLAIASQTIKPTALEPGGLETLTIGGLFPVTTWYFGIRAVDVVGEIGQIDVKLNGLAAQEFAKPRNLAPAAVTGLAAAPGLLRNDLVWTDLPDGLAGKGLDFDFYRLERSTDPFTNFVEAATGTATSFGDYPLSAFTTFYYRVISRDQEGLESAPSAPAAPGMPFTIAPQPPFGVEFTNDGFSITVSWAKTVRFGDLTPFISSGTPRADELTGYEVYRASDTCGVFSLRGQFDVNQTSYTDSTGGQAWFYLLRSSNAFISSPDSVFLTPFGTRWVIVKDPDDCVSRVEISEAQARMLNAATGPYAEDVLISRRRRVEDTGEKVMQAVEFVPLLGGLTPIKNFHFDAPVTIRLHFVTDANGNPTPQDAGYTGSGAASQSGSLSPQGANAASNMAIFWHNNKEYVKLYGDIDTVQQTASVQTPNIGLFQLRSLLREQGVTFDLSNITTRIISPNGDGRNDSVLFIFDNPRSAEVTGRIFDLRGAVVADMRPGPLPNSLLWDGRMNGTVVTSGVYVYQIKGEDKIFNGTIVVAR